MYVYKRPDSPYWWGYIERDGVDKPALRFSTKKVKKGDALRILTERAAETEAQDSGQQEITIADAVARACARVKGTPDASRFYSRAKKLHAPGGVHPAVYATTGSPHPYAGYHAFDSAMKLHELSDRHIEDYRIARINEGLKPSSINNELKVIAKALKVCKGYKTPGELKIGYIKSKSKLRYLLPGEEDKLLAELDPDRSMRYQPEAEKRAPHIRAKLIDQRDFVILLLDTGVRHTEGSELLWTAIDTTHWQNISVYRSKVDKEALLPMSRRLKAILQRRWDESNCGTRSLYVFPGWNGAKIVHDRPRGHATKGIRNAVNRAGLNAPHLVKRYSSFTVHSLRHSFAARMVQAGMPLPELRDLLGHTTVKTTEIYAHLAPTQGADRMRQILDAA